MSFCRPAENRGCTKNADAEVRSRAANRPSMTMVSSNDNSCSSATSVMHKIKENKSINQIQLHSFIRPRPKRGRAQIGESVSSSKLTAR